MNGKRKPPAAGWRRKGNGGDNARSRPEYAKSEPRSDPSPSSAAQGANLWYVKVVFKNGNVALTWRLPTAWRKTPVEVIFEGTLRVGLAHASAVLAGLITIASAMVHLLRAFGVIR